MLSVMLLQLVACQLITPEEADRLQDELRYTPVPENWRDALAKFEEALERRLEERP